MWIKEQEKKKEKNTLKPAKIFILNAPGNNHTNAIERISNEYGCGAKGTTSFRISRKLLSIAFYFGREKKKKLKKTIIYDMLRL